MDPPPILITRTTAGYSLQINPSFEADTSRFRLSVSALVSDSNTAVPLAFSPTLPVLSRASPSAPISVSVSNAAVAAATSEVKGEIIGLRFQVSEIDAGADRFRSEAEEDFYYPPPIKIQLSFPTESGQDPMPGDALLIDLGPSESILGNEILRISAEVFALAEGEASASLRSVALPSLPSIAVDPTRMSYGVDGALLQTAIKGVSLKMGEAIRLVVGLDTNNDRRISSTEPSNTIPFPVLPPPEFSIALSSDEVIEGETLRVTITVDNIAFVPQGTTLNYRITGDGITPSDLGGLPLTGMFAWPNRKDVVAELQITQDRALDGPETMTISLDNLDVSVSVTLLEATEIILGNGNDKYSGGASDESIEGASGNDTLLGGGGSDTLDGGAGNDSLDGGDAGDVLQGGSGDDTLVGGAGEDALFGGDGNDVLDTGDGPGQAFGGSGNDEFVLRGGGKFVGDSGNDVFRVVKSGNSIDGGSGLDIVVYPRPSSAYQIERFGETLILRSLDNPDDLSSIERIVFAGSGASNQGLAFDLGESAGSVAKILATVFGADAVNNKVYAGIGLDLLDRGGYSYQSLMKLALEAALGSGFASPEQVVKLLYSNVLGTNPTESEAASFVELLRDGQRKGKSEYDAAVASLGVLAADFNAASTDNIDLVGLAEKGLGYIPAVSFNM
jgi:hypothetical protein